MRFLTNAKALVAVVGLLGGCASTSTQHPSSDFEPVRPKPSGDEARILERLDDLAPGVGVRVGGLVATPDAPYTAASGRKCRGVLLASAGAGGRTSQRLACRTSERWEFVPDVFGAVPTQEAD